MCPCLQGVDNEEDKDRPLPGSLPAELPNGRVPRLESSKGWGRLNLPGKAKPKAQPPKPAAVCSVCLPFLNGSPAILTILNQLVINVKQKRLCRTYRFLQQYAGCVACEVHTPAHLTCAVRCTCSRNLQASPSRKMSECCLMCRHRRSRGPPAARNLRRPEAETGRAAAACAPLRSRPGALSGAATGESRLPYVDVAVTMGADASVALIQAVIAGSQTACAVYACSAPVLASSSRSLNTIGARSLCVNSRVAVGSNVIRHRAGRAAGVLGAEGPLLCQSLPKSPLRSPLRRSLVSWKRARSGQMQGKSCLPSCCTPRSSSSGCFGSCGWGQASPKAHA